MKSRITLLITAIWLGFLSSATALLQYPMTVTNISELQLLNVTNVETLEGAINNVTAPTVNVLGYYTPGDRGGGVFEFDANSTGTPDGGRYFIASNGWSSANGRWVRRFAGEVPNVRMWGAKGNIYDGNEDPGSIAAAHDDTAAIQNALNAGLIHSDDGGFMPGELLIPAGYYKITDTLVINSILRIHGEDARNCHLVMPYGVNKDILHTLAADQALKANDGHNHYDGVDRIEDLAFDFATENATGQEDGHNLTNAAIVICEPEEGSAIRDLNFWGGGYGIRCLDSGGIDMSFRDISCFDTAVAGICIEPVPGMGAAGGQFTFSSISGDHRWDESRSNACLIKFVNYFGPSFIEGINTEGIYGGGIINDVFPAALGGWPLGNLTIKNCYLNSGLSYSDLDAPRAFVVLDSGSQRTTPVTMENIHLFGATNLIRDLHFPRDVTAPDANSLGLNQAVVRLPLEYESLNSGHTYGDGVTVGKWSRLVVGGQAIYSFAPPTTNAWYRILLGTGAAAFLSSKATISSLAESSEFSVNVQANSDANAVELNVTRTMKANAFWAPCVTKVRAGAYQDSTGQPYPFTDIYVERALPLGEGNDYNLYQITIACPVYDSPNLSTGGQTCLLNPTTALGSLVPSGCTLLNCVTNSLVR